MADIIIIGGGVAGLSAGIYAQLNGHNATIYERHFKAGGNLTGWDRGGYHIDNCIHWLSGTNPATKHYKMWEELGALGDVDIYQADSLYTFEKDGQQISLSKDIDKMKEDMLAISPEDKKEILSLVRAVKVVQSWNGTTGVNHNEKGSLMKRILSAPALLKYHRLTTGELANRFKHPLLKGFMTALLSDYFSSLALIFVFATFSGGNGGIPEGSSCAMVERMTDKFMALGGRLFLNQEAVKINICDKTADSVTFADGNTEMADYIIIASDPAVAFGKLLDEKMMPKVLKKQYNNPKMLRFSSYHCAFSCDIKELPFHEDFVFEVPDEYRESLHTDYLKIREFSHEKNFAPEGKNILQTMTYCVESDACEFIELSNKDKKAYKNRKKRIASDIENIITSKFSELKDKIKCIDVWTPATYRRYTESEIGSYMSFAFPSKIFPRRISNRLAGIDNVILATQWLQSPGGLPIAAKAGKQAIETIMRKERRK